MHRTFKGTKVACYIGYIVQAIVNNLSPLLFVIFSKQFNISLETIGSLILINFVSQMFVDLISVKIVDRIGYKKIIVISHLCAFLGLMLLGILPTVLNNKFSAICIATVVSAVGSGMIEVTVSPIVESIPGERKTADMSLLHSFYCWGQMSVVAISTVFIRIAGEEYWYALPIIWAFLPLLNMLNLLSVPFMPTVPDGVRTPIKTLLKSKVFITAMVIMLCAGASELAMSQWSSFFAESGLGVSKITGDLLGPCLFAVFMGTGRLLYGIFGEKMNLIRSMLICAVLCVCCYITASVVKAPFAALLACAVTGFSVSLFWPGTLSLAARLYENGGAGMYGILAILGDTGCATGPWLISLISTASQNSGLTLSDGEALKFGLGFGAVFPIIIIAGLLFIGKTMKKPIDK